MIKSKYSWFFFSLCLNFGLTSHVKREILALIFFILISIILFITISINTTKNPQHIITVFISIFRF